MEGKYILSAGMDHALKLWDLECDELKATIAKSYKHTKGSRVLVFMIYLSIHLSIRFYLFINSSIHPSIYPSIRLSIHLSIYPSIHLSTHLSIYLSINSSIHPLKKLSSCSNSLSETCNQRNTS